MEGLGVNLPPGSNTVQGNDDDRFELTIRDANRALAKMRRSVGGCLTARQKRKRGLKALLTPADA